MSRLEAKIRGLYYPTPEPVLERLAPYLKIGYNTQQVNLLDPCCGTGRALRQLARVLSAQWSTTKVRTFGIEPEPARAASARSALDKVLKSSYFSTTLSDGEFHFALDNPPYDYDAESGRRFEAIFIERTTKKLVSYGIHVIIIPQEQLANKEIAEHLARYYSDVVCWRFPDTLWCSPEEAKEGKQGVPMYERFNQVVVIAKKFPVPRSSLDKAILDDCTTWASSGRDLPILPALTADEARALSSYETYTLPKGYADPQRFLSGRFEPEKFAALVGTVTQKLMLPQSGAQSRPDYLATHWPLPLSAEMALGQPLAPLKNGHLAVLAVAGIANGVLLTSVDKSRQITLKGHSTKTTNYKAVEDEESIEETWVDKFETLLWAIDMRSGQAIYIETSASSEIKRELYGTPVETMSLATFMKEFGPSLTEQVAASNPPRYTDKDSLPKVLPLPAPKLYGMETDLQVQLAPWHQSEFARLKRKPLGRQGDFIRASVNALINKGGKGGRLRNIGKIAEMATGKTYLSLATLLLASLFVQMSPALVLCPPILVRKWKREAEMTIPGIKCVIVHALHTRADADEFREFDPSFLGKDLSSVGVLERVIRHITIAQKFYERAVMHYEDRLAERKRIMKHWQATDLWEWKKKKALQLEHGGRVAPARPHEPQLPQLPERPEKPMFLVILSSSTAKLGVEWQPVYTMRPIVQWSMGMASVVRDEEGLVAEFPHCPACFQPILRPKRGKNKTATDDDEEVGSEEGETPRKKPRTTTWKLEEVISEGELNIPGEKRKKLACVHCGEPLWQVVTNGTTKDSQGNVKSTSGVRLALADYIRTRHKGFFKFLIPDEIHEGGDGTALYAARAALTKGTERGTALTGTLCNGYASSVFHTFYWISPQMRRDFGPDEVERWIDLYGMRKVTRKTSKKEGSDDDYSGDGAMSKRRTGKPVIAECPGFSPAGLKYVLPYAGFLEIGDLQLSLPPYEEDIHVVDMDPDLKENYKKFENEITNELASMLVCGDKSGLAPWFQALLGYPNMPYKEFSNSPVPAIGWVCKTKRGHFMGAAECMPEDFRYAKERELVRIIEEEHKEGRRVLVYAEHTGGFDILSRLEEVIKHEVKTPRPLKIAKLYSDTVATIDREAWLDKQVQVGVEVLLCNPKLVKVGLDLLAFPTIVFYEVPTSTSDMRQASRRSYRPGQTKRVKIKFLVYPTMEYRLLTLMARKMATSLMVEGQIPGGGLVSFSGSGDGDDGSSMMLQLARTLMESMKNGTIEKEMEVNANEVQAAFRQVAQAERDAQAHLGEEVREDEPLAFAAIKEIVLSPRTEDVPGETQQAKKEEPLKVVVIPTADITELWAAHRLLLEAQGGVAKKRKKAGKAPPKEQVALWG